MGGEHAWVNLDIGIAYVLGRTDRQMIRPDLLRAAGISCSLPKICDGKHQLSNGIRNLNTFGT
jgi:hypothetical protein